MVLVDIVPDIAFTCSEIFRKDARQSHGDRRSHLWPVACSVAPIIRRAVVRKDAEIATFEKTRNRKVHRGLIMKSDAHLIPGHPFSAV